MDAGLKEQHAFTILKIWSFSGLLILLGTAFFYLQWDGFGEQGQMNFAAVSHLLYQGYPLYVDNEFPARYSLQHGPIIYMITGAIMELFGANFITAKLSGVLAILLTLFISWKWFTEVLDRQSAIVLLGLEIWMLFHWNYIYFIRPDPFLLLCVTISMYMLSTRADSKYIILGIALPFSIAVNLKIHGILYFLPVFILAYSKIERRGLMKIAGLGGILSFIPFLLPQISLSNYLSTVFFSLDHGFRFANFVPKMAVLVLIVLLPICFFKWTNTDPRRIIKENRFNFILILPVILLVSIIASKGGSGTNHLMPFLPVFLYFYIKCILEWRIQQQEAKSQGAMVRFGAFLLILVLIISIGGFSTQKRLLEQVFFKNREGIIQEIYSIQKQYPNKKLEIGYGEMHSYSTYQDLIALPVFAGNPLYLELVAMSDMERAGVYVPVSTLKVLETGTVEIWLIPKGNKPFDVNKIVFNDTFKKKFFENYRMVDSTEFFDIWIHKSANDIQI